MNNRLLRICDFSLACLNQREYDVKKGYEDLAYKNLKLENRTAVALNYEAIEMEKQLEIIKHQKEEVLEMRDFLYKNRVVIDE